MACLVYAKENCPYMDDECPIQKRIILVWPSILFEQQNPLTIVNDLLELLQQCLKSVSYFKCRVQLIKKQLHEVIQIYYTSYYYPIPILYIILNIFFRSI